MKIVADKNIPFLRGVLEPFADVVYMPGAAITKTDVKDADALIVRTRTKCNAALLDGTRVKFIATATIGHDHIDHAYCAEHGITWTNAEGCNSSSVQQYLGAALVHLSLKHRRPFEGTTLGIVGVGNVGSKVARLARVLGMRVLLNDPPRERREGSHEFTSLSHVIEASDIITFHVPLSTTGSDATFHLADERFFARLKPGTILINTSRGEVVETGALKEALTRRTLSGCVLDVWEHEPSIDTELLTLADLATPHIAGYSADGKANGTAMSVNALSRYFSLGFDRWFPSDVPEPAHPALSIDDAGLTKEEILSCAIAHTYDIRSDDERLRRSVSTFEKQRAEYPLRREFTSYRISVSAQAPPGVKEALEAIGFTTTDTHTNGKKLEDERA
ncbi:MAG: 4-phosphoerythronate dehydrogenase PdxB [Acidobacteriota bacterium]